MAPTTSEEELEKELLNRQDLLKHARIKMANLRKEILAAEEDLLSANLNLSKVKEELRKFRDMYPNLCKPRE